MRYILFIIISVFAINVNAQKLYGNINSFDKYLVISKYYFIEKQVVDTIHFEDNNSFFYDIKNLSVGQYNLSNENVDIDFIVDKDKKDIKIYYDQENKNSFKFLSSQPNKDLNKFYKFYNVKYSAYDVLQKTLKYYPKEEQFFDIISNKTMLLKNEINTYIDSVNSLYNNYLINQIINSYKISDKQFLPDYNYDTLFAKTKVLGEDIFYALNTYQQTVGQNKDEANMYPIIDTILNTFSNVNLKLLVSDFLIKQFQHYDLYKLTEYTAKLFMQSIDNKNNTLKNNEKYQWIEAINNTIEGNKAPDFKISKKQDLYSLKSKYKILIFWASWCPHCEDFLNQFTQMDQNSLNDYKIISYSIDFEKDKWNDKIKTFPKNWINLCECNSQTSVSDKFAIYATPSIFVLDENNKIISKPMSFEELENFINKH